jgi:S-adenosylmethionine hydrolase
MIRGLSETYSDAAPGMPLALFGSYGFMEISVCDGDAASSLEVKRGDRVKIVPAARRR